MKDKITSRTLLGMLWESQAPLNACKGHNLFKTASKSWHTEIGHGELVSSGLGGVEEVHLGGFKAIEADPP